jgi:hypothetical protein
MNKKQLLNDLTCFILEQTKEPDNVSIKRDQIPYKEIKEYLLYSDEHRDYLDRRVDKLNYIDHIIKCDPQFIRAINNNVFYKYKRNRKGYLAVEAKQYNSIIETVVENVDKNAIEPFMPFKITHKKIKYSAKQIIERLVLDDVNEFICPYNKSIQEITRSKKNKFKLALTNEPVLCSYLQSLGFIKRFEDGFLRDNPVDAIYGKDDIIIVNKLNSERVCRVSIGNSLMLVNILNKDLKIFCNTLNKEYPFTHFKLLEVIISLYLLWSCDHQSFLKYLTFLSIDIIKSTMVNKYFSDKHNNIIFNTFYNDKIEELVNNERALVQSFVDNINNLTEHKLVSFIAAYYKLFIYIKNKLNREIKRFAFDFYHNQVYTTTFIDVTSGIPTHI